ncbi:MAG: hypothetical protein ABIO49_15335 [Dokdonella sp.]
MTRAQWLAVIVVVVVVAVGSIALALHRPHPPHRAASPIVRLQLPPTNRDAVSVTAQPSRAVARQAISADPVASGRLWSTLSSAVIEQKNARLMGTDAARLMRLPPVEAWKGLTARARDGDIGSAITAAQLAIDCANITSIEAAGAHASYVNHLVDGMPEDWTRFVRALDTDVQQRQATRIADCQGVGGTKDSALMAIDRFFNADDPQIQLAAAQDDDDDTEAITDLRSLAGQLDDTPSRLALAARLTKSRNVAEQSEGRAMLERLASDGDGDAVVFLAICLHEGCGFFHADPAAASIWIEQAAGIGEWSLLAVQIADLTASAQPIEAHAWALYRLELAQAGCFELGQPEIFFIATSAQTVFSQESRMTASEKAQAQEQSASLHTRWAASADAYLGCRG